jgi:hypothetical protein
MYKLEIPERNISIESYTRNEYDYIINEQKNKSQESLAVFIPIAAVVSIMIPIFVHGIKSNIKLKKDLKILEKELIPLAEVFSKTYKDYVDTLKLIRSNKIVEKIRPRSEYIKTLRDYTSDDITDEKKFIKIYSEQLIKTIGYDFGKKRQKSDVDTGLSHVIITGCLDIQKLSDDITDEKEYENKFMAEYDNLYNALDKALLPFVKQINKQFRYTLEQIPADDGEIDVWIDIPLVMPKELYDKIKKLINE